MAEEITSMMYGADYQRSLIAHLALDENFFKTHVHALQLTDFDLLSCRFVLEALKDYYATYKALPNVNTLIVHMGQLQHTGKTETRLNQEDDDALIAIFQAIAENTNNLNTEYFRQQFTDFIRSVRVARVVNSSQQLIRVGNNSQALINQIAQINRDVALSGGVLLDNAYTNPEAMTEASQFHRINTGLSRLNIGLGGGLGLGELGMVTACPGVGKTTTLLNFYEGAIITGNRALFMSLEMKTTRIKHRYQSIAAGIPANYFKVPMGEWPAEMLRRYNAVINEEYRFFGYASMMDLSLKKPTPAEIDSYIEQWKDAIYRQGHDPDTCRAVYIDWLDCINIKGLALTKDDKSHDLLKEACYELGRVARRHNVAIWTATQGNKEADGKEVLSMRHVSGAYHKNDALDVGLGLGVVADGRNDFRGANAPVEDEDQSLTDPMAGVPCSRNLVINFMKNRDNPGRTIQIYQGPTLKFWNYEQDAIADESYLAKGQFSDRHDHVQVQALGKYKGKSKP